MKEWTWSELQQTIGYGNIQNGNIITQIWNETIGDNYILKDKLMILEDEIYDKAINHPLNVRLTKKSIFNYTVKNVSKFYSKTLIEQVREKNRQLRELQRQEEEKRLKEKEERDKAFQEFKKDKAGWRDEEWIKRNIGEYYNYEPGIEYFWNVIGDNWKVANWKGDILIEDSVYASIKGKESYGLMGTTFLYRSFKSKGYSHRIIGTYSKPPENWGVYGIYEDEELVYIGMTMRDFEERWNEHRRGIKKRSSEMIFYSQIDPNAQIEFKVIVNAKDLKVDRALTRNEIEAIELGMITYFKPKYNYAGRVVNYKFKGE